MARSIKPAPMPKPRSRQMTDVTPKQKVAPKVKPKINSKVQPLKPKAAQPKGRIFKGTGTTIPALPSSSSKMGKMNRRAY